MKSIVCLILLSILSSCKKINILELNTTYCEVSINGVDYKDEVTLREDLGYRGYPYSTKERFWIENNIAYFQFKLKYEDKETFYLWGGLDYRNNVFPELNKKYIFDYNQDFNISNVNDDKLIDEYLEYRRNENLSDINGIVYLKEIVNFNTTVLPLTGYLIFTEYKKSNHRYKGTLYFKDVNNKYNLTGELNINISRIYEKN